MSQERHWTVLKGEKAEEELAKVLSELAYWRLREWRREFRAKFPRQHGQIIFGMGTESVRIGGKQYNSWDTQKYSVLKPLYEAIDDVITICGSYRLACPEDFKF